MKNADKYILKIKNRQLHMTQFLSQIDALYNNTKSHKPSMQKRCFVIENDIELLNYYNK